MPSDIADITWEGLSNDKEMKRLFIDRSINFVTEELGVQPPTTAESIIAGSAAAMTNTVLQYFALLAYSKLTSERTPVQRCSWMTSFYISYLPVNSSEFEFLGGENTLHFTDLTNSSDIVEV